MEVTGRTLVRDWYHTEFPDDPIWGDLNPNATFMGLYRFLNERKDVYTCLFFNPMDGDSLVRERCFGKLAELMRCDYDYVYEQWLRCDDEFTYVYDPSKSAPVVGDIWYSSWGYEQTNIDWYLVTKVSKCFVWLTPIGSNRTETGFMQGQTTPRPGCYCGKASKHKFARSGYKNEFYCSLNSYSNAYEWDGKPKRYSTYA